MANKIKKGDLVTLIPAHPFHNKWFGIVLSSSKDSNKHKYDSLFQVLGPPILDSYLKEDKSALILHAIYEVNLFLVQESNHVYED